MEKKLSKSDKELYKRIDEVIHYIWDPIGVSSCPSARDEYYSYTSKVFNLVKQASSSDEIAEYLNEAQSQRIGTGTNIKNCKKVASTIIAWNKFFSSPD